jgi:hypothetical protein
VRKRFGASPARIEKSLKGGGEEASNKFCPIFSCNPVAPNPLRTGLYMIIGCKQLDRRGGKRMNTKNLPRVVIEQQHQDDQPFGMHSEHLLKGLSMGWWKGGRRRKAGWAFL